MNDRWRGFTLMEVLVVLTLVGILAALAVNSWHERVQQARRMAAQASLVELAGWLERNAAASGRYDLDPAGQTVSLPFAQAPKSGVAAYALSLVASAAGYTLTATPLVDDPSCGVLSLDAAGTHGASGSLGAAACWNP